MNADPNPTTDDPFEDFNYSVEGWDGYGAQPILPETVSAARQILSLLNPSIVPDIAPGADGTIGFEWHFTDQPISKLFIEVWPDRVRSYCVMSGTPL